MAAISMHLRLTYYGDEVLEASKKNAADYMESILSRAEQLAKELAPRVSGELADSINAVRVDSAGLRWQLAADAPYALFVELGTLNRAATPFLVPAITAVARLVGN